MPLRHTLWISALASTVALAQEPQAIDGYQRLIEAAKTPCRSDEQCVVVPTSIDCNKSHTAVLKSMAPKVIEYRSSHANPDAICTQEIIASMFERNYRASCDQGRCAETLIDPDPARHELDERNTTYRTSLYHATAPCQRNQDCALMTEYIECEFPYTAVLKSKVKAMRKLRRSLRKPQDVCAANAKSNPYSAIRNYVVRCKETTCVQEFKESPRRR